MRAYIVIGALAVLAISAGIYAATTQIKQAPPGYRWAEQRGIDDEDYKSRIAFPIGPRIIW